MRIAGVRRDRALAIATWIAAIVLGNAPALAGGEGGFQLRWLAGGLFLAGECFH